MAEIWAIVDSSDLVFAVWQDANEPNGIGMLTIKGEDLMRMAIENRREFPARVAAIPCIEGEQAEAFRQVARQRGIGGMRGH